MRKKNLLLTGILLFMSWITIQFYLFVNKPQNHRLKSTRPFPWLIQYGEESAIQPNLIPEQQQQQQDHHDENGLLPVLSVTAATLAAALSGRQQQPTTSLFNFKAVASQVENLEHNLSQQIKSNDVLLKMLRTIGRIAKAEGKSISEVIAEKQYLKSITEPSVATEPVICVLLFACNRVTIKRNLDQLIKYRPNASTFPIVVSQDCGHLPTRRIIESYGDQLQFIQQPDQSDIQLKGKAQKKFKGYYKISRHYGWALNQTFNVMNYDTVLIVEDDLDIAPDFFEYFRALYPILKADPTIYCISAWNDNGKDGLVDNDPKKLYRSDFFPGLGWMFSKDLWLEFQTKWPKAFWDDWIREPEQRKNRACIRPELSRTKTFGKKGVSNGLFFEKHLKFIKLNENFVPFTRMNLSYLLKENYDVQFLKTVFNSHLIGVNDVNSLPPIGSVTSAPKTSAAAVLNNNGSLGNKNNSSPINNNNNDTTGNQQPPQQLSYRIQYNSKEQFKKTAKMFGLMDDFKSGVPRTGYQGVVSFMRKGYRFYLAPSPLWAGYNITWK